MTPKNRRPLGNLLRSSHACDEALGWAAKYGLDYERAWLECKRSDWMLWILIRTDCDESTMRSIACACARRVLPNFEARHSGDNRPRLAIETAERYIRGQATAQELSAAYRAADRAADGAADGAAYRAADSAAYSAAYGAADSAAYRAADSAAYSAAYGAADGAADWAAYGAALDQERAAQADIIRKHTEGKTFCWRTA